MSAQRVKPVGVVIKVDDEPYIIMFDRAEEVTITPNSTLTFALDGITTAPWAGVENMANILPLRDVAGVLPRPPKFTTKEEAEAWLDEYPSRV
jgi:hypothetical protein